MSENAFQYPLLTIQNTPQNLHITFGITQKLMWKPQNAPEHLRKPYNVIQTRKDTQVHQIMPQNLHKGLKTIQIKLECFRTFQKTPVFNILECSEEFS